MKTSLGMLGNLECARGDESMRSVELQVCVDEELSIVSQDLF